jgi:hypothetical protein
MNEEITAAGPQPRWDGSPTARESPGTPSNSTWHPITRILFRFTFVYVAVYFAAILVFFALALLLRSPTDANAILEYWHQPVVWVGKQIFQVDITIFPAGSGDTTYNYVEVFCFAVIAATATLFWTWFDRKRKSYPRLYYGLRIYVRFSLAAIMLLYGSGKVIKTQFPDPSLDRLLQPIGETSPMGLLWTFMGASESYTIFTGVGEMLAGLLLTTRRTTLLGALVSIGVLGHVVMLNYSYDVPVKLFSSHLLALAVFLALPDLGRLADFFLFNRRVEPADLHFYFRRKWLCVPLVAVRTVVVVGFAALLLYGAHQRRHSPYGDLGPRSLLRGIWNVEQFEVDGQTLPPLVTDASRWRRVVIDHSEVIGIQIMNDSVKRYALALDADTRTLALSKREDAESKSAFSYQDSEPGTLVLEGTLDGQKIRAKLQRADESAFTLTSRGFHWINEFPFSR